MKRMTEPARLAVGDRIRVQGTPHEEGQDTGVVAEVHDGPAYGIRFDMGDDDDGDDMGGVHRWYVGDELEAEDSGEPEMSSNAADPSRFPRAERTYTRDDDGQFSETPGGDGPDVDLDDDDGSVESSPGRLDPKVDKLRIDGRVQLDEGQQVTASEKAGGSGDGTVTLVSITGPDGPELRIGVPASWDTKDWTASEDDGTAKFTGADVQRAASDLAAVQAVAKQAQDDFRRESKELDDAGVWWDDEGNLSPELKERRDRFVDLNDGGTFAEGVITGSGWGDLHWVVQGNGDDNAGKEQLRIELLVRPTADRTKSWNDITDEAGADWAPASFNLSGLARLARVAGSVADAASASTEEPSTVAASLRRRPTGTRRDQQDWYRIENKTDVAAADVYLYGDIGMWGITASDFSRELREITAPTIDLHINSPGGDAFDGVAIYNSLVAHKARINVFVDGLAASIASVIAMAGDRIVMGRGSQLMIHDAHGCAVGDCDAIRAYIDLLDRTSTDIAGFYAARAGGSAEQWRTRMKAETWYSADEAVKAGLADEVAAAPTVEQITAEWDLSVFNFAGRMRAPAPSVARDVTAAARASVGASAPVRQPPEPEPVEFPVFDLGVFKASVAAAAEPMPGFDPEQFRHTLQALALDAPAPPAPVMAVAEPDPEPAPEPEPEPVEPEIGGFRPSLFRSALQLGVTTIPALPDPEPAAAIADEPSIPAIDAQSFVRSLREAKL